MGFRVVLLVEILFESGGLLMVFALYSGARMILAKKELLVRGPFLFLSLQKGFLQNAL